MLRSSRRQTTQGNRTKAPNAKGTTFDTLSAQLGEVLARYYGDDFALEVWEGSPDGESWYLSEMRSTGFTARSMIVSAVSANAALIGIASALIIGGIFGTIPVFAVLKPGIADSIRDS